MWGSRGEGAYDVLSNLPGGHRCWGAEGHSTALSPCPLFPPPNLPVLPLPLQGRRPLVPLDMPMSEEVGEVLATFRAASRLGRTSLGAYVISMTKRASDVLAVELLQREAAMQV